MMGAAVANVNLLAILPSSEDCTSLNNICGASRWYLHTVDSFRHLGPLLDEVAGVVICDSKLPDGTWREVLSELQRLPVEPPLIVASRLADDGLWAEVLNLGGYDVLATPFQSSEVTRSVAHAWRQWCDKLDKPATTVMVAGSSRARNL